MCFMLAKGHGGTYGYYFCLNKQQRLCDQPYMRVDDLEKQIAAKYRAIQLTKLEAEELQVVIRHTVARMNKSNSQEIQRQQRRLKRSKVSGRNSYGHITRTPFR